MARLLVYRRPGFDEAGLPAELLARTTVIDAPMIELSSTEIRRRLAAGLTVRYLVPDAVLGYVSAEGLYRLK
jgi:nicotinate-nucleotide adenylyltransferase